MFSKWVHNIKRNIFFQAGLSCLTNDGLEMCTTVKKEHFDEALTNVTPSLSKEKTLWLV